MRLRIAKMITHVGVGQRTPVRNEPKHYAILQVYDERGLGYFEGELTLAQVQKLIAQLEEAKRQLQEEMQTHG